MGGHWFCQLHRFDFYDDTVECYLGEAELCGFGHAHSLGDFDNMDGYDSGATGLGVSDHELHYVVDDHGLDFVVDWGGDLGVGEYEREFGLDCWIAA